MTATKDFITLEGLTKAKFKSFCKAQCDHEIVQYEGGFYTVSSLNVIYSNHKLVGRSVELISIFHSGFGL